MVKREKRERTKGKSREWVEGKGAGRAKWWGQTVNNAEEENGHALSRKRKQGISGST